MIAPPKRRNSMATRGYSKAIKERIATVDSTGLGVELGRLCVLHGYSVVEVAEVFGVSRMTVYNWILGRSEPSRHLLEKVQRLVDRLKQKTTPENE